LSFSLEADRLAENAVKANARDFGGGGKSQPRNWVSVIGPEDVPWQKLLD
jgi:hypothetical protein